MDHSAAPLLTIRDLKVSFRSEGTLIRAVDGVSLTINRGETLGVVGESGCGKSVTALSVMGLIPQPPGVIEGGEIRLDNLDLLRLSKRNLRKVRGDKAAMIFQEPMTSLDPVYTIGRQISEALLAHQNLSRTEALVESMKLLRKVRIPSPEERLGQYPHNLSGGMRQRVMIAMALACSPQLLIADEPTTALDVTIQAQILDLLRQLRAETGMSIMLITHSLGVVAEMADRVAVMYAGRIVEYCPVQSLFADPQHPYTVGLLGSVPRVDDERPTLATIQGRVPHLAALPKGCRFHPRCPFARSKCREAEPPLEPIKPNHLSACWLAPLEEQVLNHHSGAVA